MTSRNEIFGIECGRCDCKKFCKSAEILEYRLVGWDDDKFNRCEEQICRTIDDIINHNKHKPQQKLMHTMEFCLNKTYDMHMDKFTVNVDLSNDGKVMELTYSSGYKNRREQGDSKCGRDVKTEIDLKIEESRREEAENRARNGGYYITKDGMRL